MRARTRGAAIALLTLLMLLPAGLADAGDQHRFAERVDLAGGAWITHGENEWSDLTIRVFEASSRSSGGSRFNHEPGVVLFYRHVQRDPDTNLVTDTNYEGFAGGAGVDFRFERSLRGAFAALDLSLSGYQCAYHSEGPQGIAPAEEPTPPADCVELAPATVAIDLTWTGTGDVVRDVHRFAYDEGPRFRFRAHTVQAVREAQLTGLVAGDGLTLGSGPADVAILLRGAYHEHALTTR